MEGVFGPFFFSLSFALRLLFLRDEEGVDVPVVGDFEVACVEEEEEGFVGDGEKIPPKFNCLLITLVFAGEGI